MTRSALLLLCAAACSAFAQNRTRTPQNGPGAIIEGQVLNDSTSIGIRRARVTLRPIDAGLFAIGADGDEQGRFAIRDIAPGRYTLVAEREGFLSSSICHHGAQRMPPVITITSGAQLANLSLRLRPWAVISGKIRFEDGEPAVSVRVDAYREYRIRGRHGYNVAGSARTDDRGEFRMHGLAPGAYVIGAVYERAAGAPGEIDQHPLDADGRELPVVGYTTVFYPNTVKLSEAVPVSLDYGSEAHGIDLFLRPVRKVKLGGRVMNGVTGEIVANAGITLQRMDASNQGTLPVPAQAGFDRRTSEFQIRDVTPGTYLMMAEGSNGDKRMVGRALLNVAEQDVGDIEVVIAPERAWSGVLRVEGASQLDAGAGIMAVLEPRSEKIPAVNVDVGSGKFQCSVMGDETYDVYVRNLPDGYYLAGVRVNGTDVMAAGLEGSLASIDKPFELVIDSRGGRVAGVVSGTDGNVWSGANLALIPDPAQGRLQGFRESSADESGRFRISGVAPGRYILIGWLDNPPCDYYNPEALDACRAAGRPVTVSQAGEENVTLIMIR